MAIDISRSEGSSVDGTYKLHFCHPVAALKAYQRYWEKAITDTNVKLFKENSKFEVKDLEQVIDELNRLLVWAKANLTGTDLGNMTWRLEQLLVAIPKSCEDTNAGDCPFEIY